MNRPELYQRTVAILYTAYYNDTLSHGDCCACAVGNLVAANLGYSIFAKAHSNKFVWVDSTGQVMPYPANFFVKDSRKGIPMGWGAFVCTTCHDDGKQDQYVNWEVLQDPLVAKQVSSTGYSPKEVILIERAFESSSYDLSSEDRMFDGLCKVLDMLSEIHRVHEQETVDQKKNFSAHYQIRCHAKTESTL